MKPDNVNLRNPVIFLATWFGCGLLPRAPGTWGSLAALPFAWVLYSMAGPVALGAATIVVFAVGVWVSGRYVKITATNGIDDGDPGAVVIDEVAGQWLTLMVVPPDLVLYAIGFVLFRIADIFKPWPASWADRSIKGGFGIMVDDIIAGLYAAIGLAAISWLIGAP